MDIFTAQLQSLGLAAGLKSTVAGFLARFESQEKALARRIINHNLGRSFVRAATVSEYFCENCLQRPHLVAALLAENPVARVEHADTEFVANGDDDAAALVALRDYRHLHMTRIIWRECGGLCAVDQTLQDLSVLADRLINEAARVSRATLGERYGLPTGETEADRLLVLAMGKLGGMELNMSSDVDLVFLHSQDGQTGGKRSTGHSDFFIRQTKSVINLLARITTDGFVYRVDTRLRPFGRSGRACVSLPALEQYLMMHGREWERYAYIKQRPVTASPRQMRELSSILKPFVYRKYLDFGVFENLRDMKGMIIEEVRRKDLQTDIKRGPGGIREIEFMVQTFQLVYGGKHPALQHHGFFAALGALGAAGYFAPHVTAQLDQDYRFLRRLENGLQAARDQQVHKLPEAGLDQQRLAVLMEQPDWPTLEAQVRTVRDRVQQRFNELNLAPAGGAKVNGLSSTAENLWHKMCAPGGGDAFDDTEMTISKATFEGLRSLGTGGLRKRLDTVGKDRFDQLMPRIIQFLSTLENEADGVASVVRVLEGIGRRSAYFVLLTENEHALRRLLTMCRRSARLAEQLATSPMLLDTLVDPRGSSLNLTREGLKTRFDLQFGELDPLDDERCLLALREFRQTAVFDIAVADFEQQLSVMLVSDRLTEIAELILGKAIVMAACQMQERYGVPRYASDPQRQAEFAVVGYGKLGGLELAYGSDLDLVFLFEDGGGGETDGKKAVDNSTFFSRLAQRLIHILTVQTAYGALYEVDMRLRPSGRSGLLVSRIATFEKYQREQAWTWEHQALLRARGVSGDEYLINTFETLRRKLLCMPRDKSKLLEDVRSMRTKMKGNLDRSGKGAFDLKHGPGGLTDLEFLVQYLVLNHAGEVEALTRFSDNVRQIEALQEAGFMHNAEGESIRQIYLLYRQRLHRLSLAGESAVIDEREFSDERGQVCRALHERGLLQSG